MSHDQDDLRKFFFDEPSVADSGMLCGDIVDWLIDHRPEVLQEVIVKSEDVAYAWSKRHLRLKYQDEDVRRGER